MKKFKDVLTLIVLAVCFIFSIVASLSNLSDTTDLPVASTNGNETGFYYEYK